MENNGSTYYGCCPSGVCYPDWGFPGTDPNEPDALIEGVVQPYIKNRQITYCPEAGKTNWQAAIPADSGQPYIKALDDRGIYQSTFSQMAVNMLLTEWGTDASWTACYTGQGIYSTPDGRMASWQRPAQLMLMSGDSVWGDGTNGDQSPQWAVGNTAVWPSWDTYSQNCHDWSNWPLNYEPGWTWYIHRASARTGHFANAANTEFDLGINSGFASIAFCDGHVKAMRHNELERCDYNTQAGVWTYTYWDPRY